jgi:hypothetical protein
VFRLAIPDGLAVYVNANPSHFCLANNTCIVKLDTERGRALKGDEHCCDENPSAPSTPQAWLPLACIAKQTLRQALASGMMQHAINLNNHMRAHLTEDRLLSTVAQALDFVAFSVSLEPSPYGGCEMIPNSSMQEDPRRADVHPSSKKGEGALPEEHEQSILSQVLDELEPSLYGASAPAHDINAADMPTLQDLLLELTGFAECSLRLMRYSSLPLLVAPYYGPASDYYRERKTYAQNVEQAL